jgi:hypothetical protein
MSSAEDRTHPDDARGVEADVARIEAMRDAGTITAEEAAQLIAVLREVEAAEHDLGGIEAEHPATPAEPAAAPEANPAEPAPEPTPPPPPPQPGAAPDSETWGHIGSAVSAAVSEAAKRAADAAREHARGVKAEVHRTLREERIDRDVEPAEPAPAGTRWLRVEVMAGDIRIQGGDVDAPELASSDDDVVLEPDGDDWRLHVVRGHSSWFGQWPRRTIRATVPRDVAVRLDVKAGDVRVRDVRAVRGRMVAGDLRLDEVRGVDIHKSAGDVDARLLLTEGRHRIDARAGDIDVTLLQGSSAQVDGSVTMGDVSGGAGFERTRSGMGGRVSGRVGDGEASLRVHLSAGDLEIGSEAHDA